MDKIINIRNSFPQLDEDINGKKLIYLDSAATTLKPTAVVDTIQQHYLRESSNIHRGVHHFSELATAKYENTRDKIKTFINAENSQEIIFTRGTTESINIIASSYGSLLKEGDEIIISQMEHHSNIVPWQMLRDSKGITLKIIPMNDKGELIIDEYIKLLTNKTKIVSIVYVSNSLGTVNPVKKIFQLAHEKGAVTVLDGAQTAAHLPVDVQELGADFYAFSGHKIYGPTGIGVLYGRKELLEKMPPYQGGGDMIESVTFEKTTYNQLPYRFEAGTPHIAGVIAMSSAIDFINEIGFEDIIEHEKKLLDYGTKLLKKIAGVRIIGEADNKISILSFIIDSAHPHDIGTIVNDSAVAIRTGHHCTQPVMQHFKIPATARASLSIYNNKEDLDKLNESIVKVKEIFG